MSIAAWFLGSAAAGELVADVSVDTLQAASRSTEPDSGATERLTAGDLGLHVRADVTEGRFGGHLDYQGREALGGAFPNATLRLLYRAELVTDVHDRMWFGVGRFIAPSPVFLPTDGVRWQLTVPVGTTPTNKLLVEVFGGRRAISTSRRAISLDTALPAAGVSASLRSGALYVAAEGGIAGDELALDQEPELVTDTMVGANGRVRASYRIDADLTVGGSASLLQQTAVVVAPPASGTLLLTQAIDVQQLLAYGSWRFGERSRLDAEVVHQGAAYFSEALVGVNPPGPEPFVDPNFTDLRWRAAMRTLDRGWLRPDVRVRFRDARTELRYGVAAEVDDIGVPGPFARGSVFVDDILLGVDDVGAVDRLLWTASAGYRSNGALSFDTEAGASFIDRAVGPVSSRSLAAVQSDDLSLFVLEAQNVLFARAFVAHRRWFAGTDLEASTKGEVRAFLQLGLSTETSW